MNWNDGYFTDSTYTYGYYREISPTFQSFCLLLKGIAPPTIDENSVHCELGYGQGVSINIHAAATPGRYVGTDFNPAHAAHANQLRTAAGSDAAFYDDSFEQMLERDDLPQFDSISLHGIWSWISRENQGHIVNFVRRFLKPGGVFYNSYNCFPGWAANSPMRELFVLYDKYAHPSSNTYKRVEEAMNFTEKLLAANPRYAVQVPSIKAVFEATRKHNHDYLAHEYFNRDWICMYFTEVAEILQEAKLDFACTAVPLDAIDNLNLSPEGIAFLNEIENPVMREQARDYFVNQQFRKDIYVRGIRRLSAFDQTNRLLDMRFCLLTTDEIPLKFQTLIGEVSLSEEVYRPFIDYLREDDYCPKTIRAFWQKHPEIQPANLIRAAIILVHRNLAMPCQSEDAVRSVKKKTAALNEYIAHRAELSGDIATLASPLVGGGIGLNRFDQLFALFFRQKKQTSAVLAEAVWRVLAAQGQRIISNQKQLESPEENIEQLANMAKNFLEKQLPILKALQVI